MPRGRPTRARPMPGAGSGRAGNGSNGVGGGGEEYPASVVTKGLEEVYDLRTTAGIQNATNKVLGVDSVPTGSSFASNTLTVTGTAGVAFDRWDMSTAERIRVSSNSGSVTFTDCLIRPEAITGDGEASVEISDQEGADSVNVTFTNCEFDLNNDTVNRESPIDIGRGGQYTGTVTFDGCHFYHARRDYITKLSGNLVVTGCYFQTPSYNATNNGQHVEVIHVQGIGGTTTWTGNFVDMSDWTGYTGGGGLDGFGWTGFIFVSDLTSGQEDVTIEDSIFYGMELTGTNSTAPGYYAFQIGAPDGPGEWVMNDNIFQDGTSDYVIVDTATVTGTGNIDYDTSAAITDIPEPPSGPTWQLVTFNGSSGKLQSASALSGSSTPTKFLFACLMQYGANTNGRSLFGSNAAGIFDFRLVGSNASIRVNYGQNNEITFDAALSLQQNSDNLVIIKVDTAQATIAAGVQAYNNGSAWSPTGTWAQNFSQQMSSETPWTVGTGVNSFYGGKLKWLYFDYGEHAGTYPDFTDSGNRAKFAEGTLLVDGSNVCGGVPYVMWGGDALGDWTGAVHGGTGGGTWTYTATIS